MKTGFEPLMWVKGTGPLTPTIVHFVTKVQF